MEILWDLAYADGLRLEACWYVLYRDRKLRRL